MLSNLPIEVVVSIALLLPFQDKLNLIATCHKMNTLISTRCLYETISLPHFKNELEDAIMNFRKKPLFAKQVKFLDIKLCEISNQLYSQLPVIFPNVMKLTSPISPGVRPEIILNQFINWKDTLKYLWVDDDHHYTYRLLENNVYSSLLKLDISSVVFKNVMDHRVHLNVLKCIKNAPSLGILYISGCKISVAFLEQVHDSCSRLYELAICDGLISTSNELLPEIISPATKMDYFQVSDTMILDSNCQFLRYIAKKYTQLKTLDLRPEESSEDMMAYFDTAENDIDELALKEDHSETHEAYREKGVSILSSMANTIKDLSIDTFYFYNLPKIFNQDYVKLTKLTVWQNNHTSELFKEPNQLDLLKSLPCLKSLKFVLDCLLQVYGYNIASNSVTDVDLAVTGDSPLNDLDIGWILSLFPSLKSIRINYSSVRLICYENEGSKVFTNLTIADFGTSVVHPNLFNSLFKIAPNVKTIGSSIYGIGVKENTQQNSGSSSLKIPITPTQVVQNEKCFTIDLTGCDLEVFNLTVNLRQKMCSKENDFTLVIKPRYFIVRNGSVQVLANGVIPSAECKGYDQIIIYTRNTKTIRVNDTMIINPRRGSIQYKMEA